MASTPPLPPQSRRHGQHTGTPSDTSTSLSLLIVDGKSSDAHTQDGTMTPHRSQDEDRHPCETGLQTPPQRLSSASVTPLRARMQKVSQRVQEWVVAFSPLPSDSRQKRSEKVEEDDNYEKDGGDADVPLPPPWLTQVDKEEHRPRTRHPRYRPHRSLTSSCSRSSGSSSARIPSLSQAKNSSGTDGAGTAGQVLQRASRTDIPREQSPRLPTPAPEPRAVQQQQQHPPPSLRSTLDAPAPSPAPQVEGLKGREEDPHAGPALTIKVCTLSGATLRLTVSPAMDLGALCLHLATYLRVPLAQLQLKHLGEGRCFDGAALAQGSPRPPWASRSMRSVVSSRTVAKDEEASSGVDFLLILARASASPRDKGGERGGEAHTTTTTTPVLTRTVLSPPPPATPSAEGRASVEAMTGPATPSLVLSPPAPAWMHSLVAHRSPNPKRKRSET